MRTFTLYRRTLLHHWRINLPVILGAAVATSTLTGALIVGDSMRASLRHIALGRLGHVDHALVAQRFVGQDLAARIAAAPAFGDAFVRAVPLILMQAAATHADTRKHAGNVNLLGIDASFWALAANEISAPLDLGGREVILNETLAAELGARVGEDVLIRTGKPSDISTETLLGRRDESTSTLRLTVRRIVPAEGLGAFGLLARQTAPMNAYVPLPILQRSLDQPEMVNAVLVDQRGQEDARSAAATLNDLLKVQARLTDYGLTVTARPERGYAVLESDGILIPEKIEQAAYIAAEQAEVSASPILTHLANSLTLGPAAEGESQPTRMIPYSTVSAICPASSTAAKLAALVTDGKKEIATDEIWLNRWAADDLQASIGDSIVMTYYVAGALGRIETRSAQFTLQAIVEMRGAAADPGFIPEYPGVTDTQNLADWNPPFPVDLKLVRQKDEDYWDEFRTTPKAYVTLEDGQRLWSQDGDRFGRLTSIRFSNPPGTANDVEALAERVRTELLRSLEPAAMGLSFEPVRTQAMQASRGTTDFGMLFIGFSFFLIASAAMLVGLLFRLGVERRTAEVGIRLAVGFHPQSVARQLVAEGALLAGVGALVGLVGAVAYARLMLVALATWWADAVNAPLLVLSLKPSSVLIGLVASLLLAALAAAWATRGLLAQSVRSLLAGAVGNAGDLAQHVRRRRATALALVGILLAAMVTLAGLTTERIPPVLAFFFAGTFMLIGTLALIATRLATDGGSIATPGASGTMRLAMRNASRHRGRSMLICTLIASATFVITAMETFRIDRVAAGGGRNSGTGGFALYAESAAPLPYDLNSPDGRAALGIERDDADFSTVSAMPFRLRLGDSTSCLNLYVPREPRILGASSEMTSRGGFRFASALDQKAITAAAPSGDGPAADSHKPTDNAWELLNADLGPRVIPAIGDEAAVLWQLHSGLGKEIPISDERGEPATLRFVALLKGSMLQDEIIISEERFIDLFPSISGHSFFLIETPAENSASVEATLERRLDRFAFDVAASADRLASYSTVQNTYLSTFQTLGGLGLLLGTFGLAAVVLRNVWERRREFALLRAVGYRRYTIGGLVLLENFTLVVWGLFAGVAAAALAVLPRVWSAPGDIPWLSVALLLGLVLVAGVLAGGIGFQAAVRAPLLRSLRSE